MNTWESELTAAIEARNEDKAISILDSGFPVNFHIHMKDLNGNF
jgi:hypothetical protein